MWKTALFQEMLWCYTGDTVDFKCMTVQHNTVLDYNISTSASTNNVDFHSMHFGLYIYQWKLYPSARGEGIITEVLKAF